MTYLCMVNVFTNPVKIIVFVCMCIRGDYCSNDVDFYMILLCLESVSTNPVRLI